MQIATFVVAVLLPFVCFGQDAPAISSTKPTAVTKYVKSKTGLQYADIVPGQGREVHPGDVVTVHYTGWLEEGEEFDSSANAGKPFTFKIGQSGIIDGWNEGVQGMKVGGIRQLKVPPQLGYGARAYGKIPGMSVLIFEIQLLSIK